MAFQKNKEKGQIRRRQISQNWSLGQKGLKVYEAYWPGPLLLKRRGPAGRGGEQMEK